MPKIEFGVLQDPESFEPGISLCKDIDLDCHGISDKVGCWLYDPEQGICPFLTGQIATTKPTDSKQR